MFKAAASAFQNKPTASSAGIGGRKPAAESGVSQARRDRWRRK